MPRRFLVLLVAAAALPAADPPAVPYHLAPWPTPNGSVCHRATGPVRIDGDGGDPAWAAAGWTDPFADIEGDRRPKPRHRTQVKMLWDDAALYILAELDEPHVWGTIREHDAVIFQDNDFEVFVDPDGDGHLYAELEVNALNTTWDLLLPKPYKDGGRAVNGWEVIGLRTAVKVNGTLNDPADTDRGWTVEIAWPWAGLKELTAAPVPPRDGDQWRINFSRVEWDTEVRGGKYEKVKGRPEHNWVWSPHGVIDMHRPERWGYLQFSTGKPGGVAYQPDPAMGTRDVLHRVLYAQGEYRKRHGRFAGRVADLGLPAGFGGVTLEATRNGFEAAATAAGRDGKPRRWAVNQEGRCWGE